MLQGSLTATVRVHTHTDNVAGVKLPVFRQYEIQSEVKSKSDRDNLGLAQGGRQIKACKEKFTVFLTNLVRLASLQTSFITLDEALKVRTSVVPARMKAPFFYYFPISFRRSPASALTFSSPPLCLLFTPRR